MDPLSVALGVITLIGAVKVSIDGLVKLKAFYTASEDITMIINEVMA